MMDVLFAAEAARSSGSDGYWHLAMILAAIGLLGVFARLRRRNRGPVMTAKEYREMDKHPDRYRNAADKAMVEMLETASQLTAEVNTKCRVLNRLVKDAETQADRLEKLIAEARGVDAAAPAAAEAIARDIATEVRQPDVEKPPAQPQPAGGGSQILSRVGILRDQGKSVAEIAKATNLSTIEVTFALQSLGAAMPHQNVASASAAAGSADNAASPGTVVYDTANAVGPIDGDTHVETT
ncbi:MAG: hypothetical protein LIP23_05160 [Planctomycetes bacterium]|nr:hypothetical protein [Planctomycetota bacterium]